MSNYGASWLKLWGARRTGDLETFDGAAPAKANPNFWCPIWEDLRNYFVTSQEEIYIPDLVELSD